LVADHLSRLGGGRVTGPDISGTSVRSSGGGFGTQIAAAFNTMNNKAIFSRWLDGIYDTI
jgi:hypothetical protein